MTGKIHEVQGNEHSSRDSGQSHMEVRESLYMHEIELQMIATERRLNMLNKKF